MHRSLCICALLPHLETRTRVVLLLHQLEAPKPTSTGVVAARCLANSAVVHHGRAPADAASATDGGARGDGDARAGVDEEAARVAAQILPGARAAYLFPHAGATPLWRWRGDDGAPVTLIVPEGTWRQAARARARVARVLDLPCVCLPDPPVDAAARGRLRAAARPGHLATLEAIARALGVLEGADVEAALLHVFAVMTDRTLWSNGRLARDAVTGGVPDGARSHDPLAVGRPQAPPHPRTRAAP
jgi:DTW domain-containing protein